MYLLRHSLVIIGVVAAAGIVGGLIFMYSGVFNVAASDEDSSALNWALVTVREASIGRHSRDVVVPLDNMVADRDAGFQIYRRECVMCHTPIGRSPRPMAVGFNPQAPGFGADADDMGGQELFWVPRTASALPACQPGGPL